SSFLLPTHPTPRSTLFPYTTLFRSCRSAVFLRGLLPAPGDGGGRVADRRLPVAVGGAARAVGAARRVAAAAHGRDPARYSLDQKIGRASCRERVWISAVRGGRERRE